MTERPDEQAIGYGRPAEVNSNEKEERRREKKGGRRGFWDCVSGCRGAGWVLLWVLHRVLLWVTSSDASSRTSDPGHGATDVHPCQLRFRQTEEEGG